MSGAKTKFSASSFSSKFTDFRAFLKIPILEADYLHIAQLEIIPDHFANFTDFIEYDISSYLQQTGLYELFFINSKQGYYSSLIYLFFTNLIYEDDDFAMLSTLFNGIDIDLTPKSLGNILNILSQCLALNEIEMDDEKVLSKINLPGQGPPMANNKLQPISRLIGRLHTTFVQK